MKEIIADFKKKSTFHEIKNQISVCKLYLEIIKKTLAKENYKNDMVTRALATISNSVRAIETSMYDLKAQINPVAIKKFNLCELVNDVFLASVGFSENKQTDFINEVDINTEINADRDKMYSVLINLCKNAVEAIPEKGYIKISFSDNSIFVENNGVPIPYCINSKIFDDGFTTKPDGTGLGLMLVKKLLSLQKFGIKLLKSDVNSTVFEIIGRNP